jgi:hypothetical protein
MAEIKVKLSKEQLDEATKRAVQEKLEYHVTKETNKFFKKHGKALDKKVHELAKKEIERIMPKLVKDFIRDVQIG